MRTFIRQVGTFVLVGCAAAATHWAVTVACVEWAHMPPLLANLFGWLVAFVVSFTGHYQLTFRYSNIPLRVAAGRFFMISAAGFIVNESAYAWLLHTTSLPYDLLLAIILVGLAVLTFLASRFWAFRHKHAN